MVRVKENKLIIEIELGKKGKTPDYTPAEKVESIQNAIFEAIKHYNYKDFGEPQFQYELLELLREMLPTFDQQASILKSK